MGGIQGSGSHFNSKGKKYITCPDRIKMYQHLKKNIIIICRTIYTTATFSDFICCHAERENIFPVLCSVLYGALKRCLCVTTSPC